MIRLFGLAMKKNILSLLFITATTLSYAGGEKLLFGARSLGLGHASATFTDLSSAYNNQAGLGFVTQAGIQSYTEQRFLVGEMTYGGLVAVMPTQSGTFSLTTTYFGYPNYNETQIGVGYGLKLSDNFSAGIQIDYLNTSLIEFGSKGNVTFEAGILAKMTDQLTFAAHIYNPTQAKLGESLGVVEKTPGIFKTGLSYLQKDKYLISVEAEKDIDYDPFLKVGIEVYLSEKIVGRAGIGTNPSNYSIGLGYQVNNLTVDVAGSQSEFLGFTPAISLSWKFDKRAE